MPIVDHDKMFSALKCGFTLSLAPISPKFYTYFRGVHMYLTWIYFTDSTIEIFKFLNVFLGERERGKVKKLLGFFYVLQIKI